MMGGDRLDDARRFTEPLRIIGADCRMGSFHLVIDGLADIVQESRPLRLLDVHLQFGRHHPRQMGNLDGMLEDVLGIARPELEAARAG